MGMRQGALAGIAVAADEWKLWRACARRAGLPPSIGLFGASDPARWAGLVWRRAFGALRSLSLEGGSVGVGWAGFCWLDAEEGP